jgi:hypothetical protein
VHIELRWVGRLLLVWQRSIQADVLMCAQHLSHPKVCARKIYNLARLELCFLPCFLPQVHQDHQQG